MKILKALVTFIELWAEYGDEIIELHNKLVAAIKSRKEADGEESTDEKNT